MPQLLSGLLPQHHSYDEDEVDSPRMMMTFTAVPAARWLAQFLSRTMIGGNDMRHLMKTRLLAFTHIEPVVRPDLHPALTSIGAAASAATRNGYRLSICRERGPEPGHFLDGVDIGCAPTIVNYSIILHKHCRGQLAHWQACRELRAIRCFL